MEQVAFPVSSLAYFIAVGMAVGAAGVDVAVRRVPNGLAVAAGLVGLGLGFGYEGPAGMFGAIAGFSIAFGVFLPGYLLGFTGGGDLKLVAGLGCFLGPELSLAAGLLYYPAGAVFAVLWVSLFQYRESREGPLRRYRAMFREMRATGRFVYLRPNSEEYMGVRVPMAPAIAFATIAAPLM